MPLSRSRDYLSIGEVLEAVRGEFPDVSISKIRFLETEGLLDPRAHLLGLSQVLRGGRRPVALHPVPPARPVPPAASHQGPARLRRAERGGDAGSPSRVRIPARTDRRAEVDP